ncbi:MAG TPA: hypothetical protein DE045_02030 [Oceanospirillaceae bacterium]|nr:hypothetical protein [Oceanospirillaceae bacterium]
MSLRIAQITDCHLQAHETTLYKGVNADGHLDQCLAWLQSQAAVDLLVLTGDLSHFGSADAYHRLKHKVSAMGIPSIWLAGNHDDSEAMQRVCGQAVQQVRSFGYDGWQLLTVDTNHAADGQGGGSVSEASLRALEQALIASKEHCVCLFMHHNAVAVNSAWQDDIMLANAAELNAIVAAHPKIKAVVCGHVHQQFDQQIGATRYLATPSSAVQFSCEQQHFHVDHELGPGLRLLQLTPAGELHTQVHRLTKL